MVLDMHNCDYDKKIYRIYNAPFATVLRKKRFIDKPPNFETLGRLYCLLLSYQKST